MLFVAAFFAGGSPMRAANLQYSNRRETAFAIAVAILIAVFLSAMAYGLDKLYDVFVASRL